MEILFEDKDRHKRYKSYEKLGEGAYGEVRLGIDSVTGMPVAMKYIAVSSKIKGIPRAVFREVQALRQLQRGSNVVELLDVFPEETSLCLVLEYLPSDLAEAISQAKGYFSKSTIVGYSRMILQGIAHCHSRNIIHRDIKPSNILISSCGQIKLGDFGLARVFDEFATGSLSHQVATRMYRAPELLFASRRYNLSSDIWSCGAVLAELIMLAPIFPGSNDIDQIFRVFQVMGTPTETSWPGVESLPDFSKVTFPSMEPMDFRVLMPMVTDETIEFVQLLLQLDPSMRISATAALKCSFFTPSTAVSDCFTFPVPHRAASSPSRLNGYENTCALLQSAANFQLEA